MQWWLLIVAMYCFAFCCVVLGAFLTTVCQYSKVVPAPDQQQTAIGIGIGIGIDTATVGRHNTINDDDADYMITIIPI